MHLLSRLFALILAALPAVWGMCPCGIVEICPPDSGADVRGTPCCPDDESCPGEPSDGRHPSHPGPCKGCAFMEAGRGVVAPSPTAMPVPPAECWLIIHVLTVDPCAAHLAPEARTDGRCTGPPPLERLATVVLLI